MPGWAPHLAGTIRIWNRRNPIRTLIAVLVLVGASSTFGKEYHVSVLGDDAFEGSRRLPLHTISAAARVAQPGDVITVHAGVYRERVNPPRGGESNRKRIVYQAAPGEKVVITGSEFIRGWEKLQNDTWKVTIPNSFFGDFNPYSDVIHGDRFAPNGRIHHTGAVYLNGVALAEAASHLNEVLKPASQRALWFGRVDGAEDGDYLLNLAAITVGRQRIGAEKFTDRRGELHAATDAAVGQCVGWIRVGSWLRYDHVDFGDGSEELGLLAASVTGGGDIEIRLDQPDGELLGTCSVTDTGDWHHWATFKARIRPTRGKQSIWLVFHARKAATDNTTIWAQFPGVNPNEQPVEINVRQTVFTPSQVGVNYLTLRGFTLRHAATPWAPPTAGQVGLVTAYWCKGWIIENNEISHSRCSGVALGKYSDAWDNRAESAEGYTGTLTRALTNGWNKATVGGHLVRNNRISHCEQAGIVGSLGCTFSRITGNEIRDIHEMGQFGGAEMAGIRFHGAIDVEISHNHIYRAPLGIGLDRMAQGPQVLGNLLHDNGQDLVLEVDHGPVLVANNLFLSRKTQDTSSQGSAYAHNLMAGALSMHPFDERLTPFHQAHATELAGMHNSPSGDVRFYNNLFVQPGDTTPYDTAMLPVGMAGNVYLKGAKPSRHEVAPLLKPDFDPQIALAERPDGWYLEMAVDCVWAAEQKRRLVTTAWLGQASIPRQPFENVDGSPVRIHTDYFGRKRRSGNPFPGPIEFSQSGKQTLKVWPNQPKFASRWEGYH